MHDCSINSTSAKSTRYICVEHPVTMKKSTLSSIWKTTKEVLNIAVFTNNVLTQILICPFVFGLNCFTRLSAVNKLCLMIIAWQTPSFCLLKSMSCHSIVTGPESCSSRFLNEEIFGNIFRCSRMLGSDVRRTLGNTLHLHANGRL